MDIAIVNNCNISHRLDFEKVLNNILSKIPSKFIVGLEKIEVYDIRPKGCKNIRYVKEKNNEGIRKIEIYMDHPDFKGFSFFSYLSFNVLFLFSITEHIEEYVKKITNDKEILSYPSSMANYNWMYFGRWQFVLSIFRVLNFLISKIVALKKLMLCIFKALLK